MNPSYRLQIDLYIRTPVEANSVWMRRIGSLPFVPRSGDTLRMPMTDDDEQQMDITLDEVVWDMSGGMFVATLNEESVVEAHSNGEAYTLADAVAEYKPYGFIRLNYPQGQLVR